MLSYFSVNNFRNLRKCEFEFAKVNIFVGPNNSGKSNLFRALCFLANILSPQTKGSALLAEIDKNGGSELLRRGTSSQDEISLRWRFSSGVNYSNMEYTFLFRILGGGSVPIAPLIVHEELCYAKPEGSHQEPFSFFQRTEAKRGTVLFTVRDTTRGDIRRLPFPVRDDDLILCQSDQLLEAKEFREEYYPLFKKSLDATKDLFQNSFVISSAAIDLRFAKEATKLRLGESRISRDASDFVAVLHHLENKYDFFGVYRDVLAEVLPHLEGLKIVLPSDKSVSLRLFFKDGEQFSLHEMSDGTTKAMILAMLLWNPEKLAMLFIDEPELNLHPAWQRVLAHWILRARGADQIFLSTHSPDFLDAFTESFRSGETALFIGTPTETASFHRLSPKDVEESLNVGWELGDLYRVGDPSFGGWPW